jgi:superfamily II RNA helicase
MVKICPQNYPKNQEEKYQEYFNKYPFPLSTFQKYAVESIVNGDHILVTAHTGSGKTLPGEFAIEHFVGQGKKVIYTAPIKALSNQKFYEFTKKYPHISFGILTGDIKFNPEADVLIMTTEILQNTLYRKKSVDTTPINTSTPTPTNLLLFDMDMEKELACVIFDEVHYINDPERGKVWEETMMMLPKHVQMVMLSATLDQPEKFALWCENRYQDINDNRKPEKQVYLTTTYERVVPLVHYTFLTSTQAIFKTTKDKTVQEEMKKVFNHPFVLQDEKGVFQESNYLQMTKMLERLDKKELRMKRSFVLNQVLKYLVEREMLPALCFVLSRKMLEQMAKEITTNLLEFDSKVPYTIRRECEQIIRKLPNYQEYLQLPEYLSMVALLEKGIAIHHAGVMPILREMVELLYAKGYIKIVFCTETFAVGINMPTKTVLFTDITKFDGNVQRVLYSHEYTQMGGRAGRRGMDTIGHVIHLNNLFHSIDSISYKTMMKGKPQTLVSKFKISYNLLLNLMDTGHTDFLAFVKKSMIQGDLDQELNQLFQELTSTETELQKMEQSLELLRTPYKVVNEWIELKIQRTGSVNKKRKEIERKIQEIENQYKFISQDEKTVNKYNVLLSQRNNLNQNMMDIQETSNRNIHTLLGMMENDGFVEKTEQDKTFLLTLNGKIATNLREIPCLPFTKILSFLQSLSSVQLVSFFSCFTNITVSEDYKSHCPETEDAPLKKVLTEIETWTKYYLEKESYHQLNTGTDYQYHFDLLGYVEKWCQCNSVEECKFLLQTIGQEKEIFLGEFVKALLKINNISGEMEKIAELIGDMNFLQNLREVPALTLKYVVTNQSLYL